MQITQGEKRRIVAQVAASVVARQELVRQVALRAAQLANNVRRLQVEQLAQQVQALDRSLKAPVRRRGPDIIKTASGTLKRCKANPNLFGVVDDDEGPADLTALLKRTTFGRSTLRPFVDEDGELKGMACVAAYDDTSVDEKAMIAKFLISTPAQDRSRDVVHPAGLLWDDYARNPLVLWDHGNNPNVPFPVGTSRDPSSGRLAVEVTRQGVFAKCFFGRGVPQSEDLFKLVHQGIVKAASIHMIAPIEARERTAPGGNGRPGYEITRANIAEWSLVSIPCNQDAVRKAASSGRLLNEWLTDEVHQIVKSMAANLPQPVGHVRGWGWEG